MKLETIIECVNKLSTNYDIVINEKLKDERIKFLFDTFKNRLDESLRIATDRILYDENIKKFPTIIQIENYMPVYQNTVQRYCTNCEGTGYYTVWQYRESIGKYYTFAYRCQCNTTSMQNISALISEMIPDRAHNPFPKTDNRHKEFSIRK